MAQSRQISLIVSRVLDWFFQNARDLPWRRTRDPYAIWVSEIMLQQTQVKTVIPFWERWMRELPTIESLANAPSEKIHKLWEGLGYYTRVRNMQKAARAILEKHGGRFPEHFDEVLSLPGIGRYTAGAICSIAFNQPTPILDGNVIRVLTRVFGIAENPRDKETNARLWKIAEELVCRAKHAKVGKGKTSSCISRDSNSCSRLNQSLMELGALVCTPRQPKCDSCPIKKLCVASRENRIAELPNPGSRGKTTARRFAAFVVTRRGQFLVRQRPTGVVNAHLWEFPNVELNGETDLHAVAKSTLGFRPVKIQRLCTIRHSITRYRIMLEAFVATVPRKTTKPTNPSRRWLKLSALDKLPFPSAHRKLLARVAEISN